MTSYAQDHVGVRGGPHGAYSRLVFDWEKPVKFSLFQSDDGRLTVSFAKDATLDQSKALLSKLANVQSMTVLSTKPLKVMFKIPEDSEVKSFYVQRRVVIDVYNPVPRPAVKKSKAVAQEEVSVPRPPVKKTTPEIKVVKNEAKVKTVETKPKKSGLAQKIIEKLPHAGDKPVEAQKTEIAVEKEKHAPAPHKEEKKSVDKKTPPVEFVLVDEHAPAVPLISKEDAQEEHEAKSKQSNVHAEELAHEEHETEDAALHPPLAPVVKKHPVVPVYDLDDEIHVITVTSTNSVGMAVFESFGDLWLFTDISNHHLRPKINSTRPEMFEEFEEITPSLGMAYRTRFPEGFKMHGDGGELMWRLILSDKAMHRKAVQPVREVGAGLERSGKMTWPFKTARQLIELDDPMTGQVLKVVTVEDAKDFAGAKKSYVDFEVLHSPIGLVIRPKVDDLKIQITDAGVVVSRSGGLAMLPEKKMSLMRPSSLDAIEKHRKKMQETRGPRIFNFAEWQMGPASLINRNKNIILANMSQNTEAGKVEDMVTLAKMYIAHGRSAEAIGFLTFAHQEMPALERNAEFIALRGVANAFDRKSEVALGDLLDKRLEPYEEIRYWKAFVLADLGDWQQAAEILPDHFGFLYDYPDLITHRLALSLAEIALRAGKVEQAEELLVLVEHDEKKLAKPLLAALKYLQGEALRQRGKVQDTIDIWQALTKGQDDLFRAKSGLALTRLLEQNKQVDHEGVIDRLERLRYAWRGDELEAQINYWLARAYLEQKDYVKSLMILRDAASIASDTPLGRRITAEMSDVFSALFLGEELKNLSPLDAVALFEQFSELTPSGEDGNKLVQQLAEHLVRADLLGRASRLLKHQVDHRVKGEEKVRVAVRLAGIFLLDKQPEKALDVLKKASDTQKIVLDGPVKKARDREIILLKANAFSQANRPDQALALLRTLDIGSDVSRLKADIAWRAGYWQDAAEALLDVLADEQINAALSDLQRDLIMNTCISLSLANDRIGLANLRQKFSPLMAQTNKAHLFEVITRPRQNGRLADRDTLMSVVSEVDLFKDFLESYRVEAK